MTTSFIIEIKFQVTPVEIYNSWLDSEKHTAMTGGEANCSNKIGDSFSAWDGYISGKNLELIKNKLIVQNWRTTEFEDEDDDSLLRIELNDRGSSCIIKLIHANIPEGQPDYLKGWHEFYFNPMKAYFEGIK